MDQSFGAGMAHKRKSMKNLLLILMTVFFLSACSGDAEESTTERANYAKQSAQIGHDAAQSIKVPMDRAENMVDMENQRLREYEKSLSDE